MLTELENIKTPVEDRLSQPKFIVQKIALIATAIAIVCLVAFLGFYFSRVSDPYVREVLSLSGTPSKGHAMFQINCSGCHLGPAEVRVGPNLQNVRQRKSKVGIIYQVTSGKTPPMPKFQPTPQEMADLLSYLEKL